MGGGGGNEETLLFWNILSSHRVLVIAESVVFGTFTAGLLIDDFRAASCPVRGCPGASENPPQRNPWRCAEHPAFRQLSVPVPSCSCVYVSARSGEFRNDWTFGTRVLDDVFNKVPIKHLGNFNI